MILGVPKKDRTDIFRMMDQRIAEKSREDNRKRVFLTPVRVLWQSENGDQSSVENSEILLENREPQISLQAVNPCIMHNRGKEASILLDFGCEIHGGAVLYVWQETKGEGVKVRVRFGESAMEAMSEIGKDHTATNDHALRDFTTVVHSMSMNPVGETGFRFLRLDLLEPNASLVLKAVKGVLVYKDIPYRGSFRSSDELLNRIWDTGAYTVHLNMQNYIWDGIKRDRLIWAGDMHPEITTIQSVFGFDDCVPASLDLVREETPLPGWMNGFPCYSMWWILSQHDWFMYTGDVEYLKKQREYLIGLEQQLSGCIGEDGKDVTPEVRFVDWPSSEDRDVVDAGIQAIHILAASKLKKLFHILEEPEMEALCETDLERLKQWKGDYKGSKQAAALMVLAGMLDAADTNAALLGRGGAEGMSTFMGYYILSARAMAGDIQGCLDCVREYWGGMLSLGATTFWEDFDIRWMENGAPIDELTGDDGRVDVHGAYGKYCYKGYRHSLCHGWASGVTPWLTEHILGIRVKEPGCRKLEIAPRLGDLQWVEGTFPTPYGDVFVSHRKKENGMTESVIESPKEVDVVLIKDAED